MIQLLCAEGLTLLPRFFARTFADDKFAATHLHWVYHIANHSISQQFGSENRVYYTPDGHLTGVNDDYPLVK